MRSRVDIDQPTCTGTDTLALPLDQHRNLALRFADPRAQFLNGARRPTIDRDDHVAGAQSCLRGRAGRLLHEQAAVALQRARFVTRQRTHRDAELALRRSRRRSAPVRRVRSTGRRS